MRPETVRFTSQDRRFEVYSKQCGNPDCDCTDVTFRLVESLRGGRSLADPIHFEIRVDPETWREIEPPERSKAEAELVREFLRDYPVEERAKFREAARRKIAFRRRLREYRIDPRRIWEGLLIPFGKIASESGSISSGGVSYCFSFEHAGVEYLVDDLYCSNPDCRCREVHLVFFRSARPDGPDGRIVIEERFTATLSLDGRLKIDKRFGCSRAETEAGVSAWEEQRDRELDNLKWRYEVVKRIGRRSLSQSFGLAQPLDLPFETSSSQRTRVARNELCPCGSGKKYKKCCGRKKDAAPRR